MPKASFKLVALAAAFIIAVAAGVVVDGQRKRRDAEDLFKTVRSFVVGATTLSAAQKELQQFGKYRNMGIACDMSDCTLGFDVTNKSLKFLHLASPVEVGTTLRFSSNMLQYKTMNITGGTFNVVYITESDPPPNARVWPPKIYRDKTGVVWKALIHITPQSTSQERAVLDSFNFRCLTKIGGCTTGEEMAPAVSQIVSGSQ